MSEYNEDDLIEAVRGDEVIRGRVNGGGEIMIAHTSPVGGLTLHYFSPSLLEGDGFTVTTIEKAKPPLPTEPGAYKYDGWCHVAVLNDVGEWRDVYGNLLTVTHLDASSLIRLEPVAETAKKVLDAIWPVAGVQPTVDDAMRVATEFGVTS